MDPRQVAFQLLGAIDWQTEVSGFCRCPGEAFHTSANGKKDCRVNVDGAPTIFCFHASCAPAVAEANRRLRRELGASPWELRLPGGKVLRSGDVLQASGVVAAARGREGPRQGRRPASRASSCSWKRSAPLAERFPAGVVRFLSLADGADPRGLALAGRERDAEDQFRTWLKLWPACSTVWIGDVLQLGQAGAPDAFPAGCGVVPDRAGDGELHLRVVVQAGELSAGATRT